MAGNLARARKAWIFHPLPWKRQLSAPLLRAFSVQGALMAEEGGEQYIQQSKVPTLHFQRSLPRLPIPKLRDTCRRYLVAQRPLLEEEYRYTEGIVKEFGREGGQGEALNKMLISSDKQNKQTSYIADIWFDMYLRDRAPLVLNHNPFIGFKEDPNTSDQAVRAANFIWSAVRFRASLQDGLLAPEIYHLKPSNSQSKWINDYIRFVPSGFAWFGAFLFKSFPLDMSQYHRLFNSTRVPRRDKDELVSHSNGDNGHVIVMRNGHFYVVEAVQPDGLPVDPSALLSQVRSILSDPLPPPPHPLGYLTSLPRARWAGLREELVQDPSNAASLEKIDSALFVLCLDDHEPTTAEELSHTMLHNQGRNRWFDKTFSLIVTKGALSAINFEHAWGDGVAVLRLFNEVYQDTCQRPLSPDSAPSLPPPSPLEFKLSPMLQEGIAEAKESVEQRTKALTVSAMVYEGYGKNLIKQKKLSPDALMQLSFQIAYYRQYKCCVPTYESCSTAAFRHGRTETIRPASVPAKACAEAFDESGGSLLGAEDLMKLVSHASAWHSQLTKEAAMGQGFDRHLLALKTLAQKAGTSAAIFEDPAYSQLNHIILSTSTLPSDTVLVGGFAPVSPDGYGVGYGVKDDSLGCNIATYPTRDGAQFVQNLKQVWEDLLAVLCGKSFR